MLFYYLLFRFLKIFIVFISEVLDEFKHQFDIQKQKPGNKENTPAWAFNSAAVFSRLDTFLQRLSDIKWLFLTVLEFSKLEKIEIGGVLGRSLSVRIMSVYKDFQHLFAVFTAKAADALEPDDETFSMDCKKFAEAIDGLDSKLAAVFCQAFDDCKNLESVFKVSMLKYCE